MSVTRIVDNSILRLRLNTGVNGSGDPTYSTKSLSNVKPAATDQDVYAVAQALAALQNYVLTSIARVDNSLLEDIYDAGRCCSCNGRNYCKKYFYHKWRRFNYQA